MSNHTIATPITTWARLRTVDHAIEDGTIPAVHIGRRVLIPRRPFLRAFGIDDDAPA